ncbi:MAG: ribosome recycling factor, partial [Ruminococcus sp.]|nr:ribosome recycling factor [Ruminococcus sp.]
IEKAIQMSDVGINPQNDGKVLRLIFPPLTEDKRKEIAKDIAHIAEDCKVQIRNVRRDTIEKLKKMKKSGELTEDDLDEGEKKIQKSTDKFIKKIDELTAAKKKEIMEI